MEAARVTRGKGGHVITQERLLLVCGACAALGALAIDAAAQEAPEPLWAYAYSTPPKPDDKIPLE